MNKKEAAEYLGITTRTLERHMSAEPRRIHFGKIAGRRGEEVYFEPEEVERFRKELRAVVIPGKVVDNLSADSASLSSPSTSLVRQGATQQDGQQFALALRDTMREAVRSVASELGAHDAMPVAPAMWLTLQEASEWLGLPRRQIERALHADRESGQRRIRTQGAGRGLRLRAVDVLAYFD